MFCEDLDAIAQSLADGCFQFWEKNENVSFPSICETFEV